MNDPSNKYIQVKEFFIRAKCSFSALGIIVLLLGQGKLAFAHPQYAQSEDSLTYHLFKSEANTVGYDIFVNKKLFIHQPNIPGIPGNAGFVSHADAETVAKLVVRKIRSGMMPPTVDLSEMDSLHIKYKK